MDTQGLISGLSFSVKHELTIRETETLIPLLTKDYTLIELSRQLGRTKESLNYLMQRLKIKKLVVIKGQVDTSRTLSYGFNTEILEE